MRLAARAAEQSTRSMGRRLSQVETNEVSYVDRGAVRHRFALLKKDGTAMDEKILKAALEQPLENEAAMDAAIAKAGISEEAGLAIKASARVFAAYADQMTPDQKAILASGISKAEGDEDEEEEAAEGDAAAEGSEDGEAEEGSEPPADDEDEDEKEPTEKAAQASQGEPVSKTATTPETITKAEHESLQKAHSDLQAKFETIEKAHREAIEKAEQAECIAKAEKEFKDVGAPAEVGMFIHQLKKASLWNEVSERILKGAQERAKAAELFSVKGSGASNPSEKSAEAELNKAAENLAAEKKIPFHKAYKEVISTTHRELYGRYEQERRSR